MRRINLLRAHGSPTGYLYGKGCRCTSCRGERSVYSAAYYAAHRDEAASRERVYRSAHFDVISARQSAYAARYRVQHPEMRAYRAWWSGAWTELSRRRGISGVSIPHLFTAEEYVARVEGLFSPGMTWANYGKGGWHNDHILPRRTFRFGEVGDDNWRVCWGLANLRPMWGRENVSRQDRVILADGSRADRCEVVRLPVGMTIERAVALLAAAV